MKYRFGGDDPPAPPVPPLRRTDRPNRASSRAEAPASAIEKAVQPAATTAATEANLLATDTLESTNREAAMGADAIEDITLATGKET